MCAKRLAEELNEGFIEDYSTPSKKPRTEQLDTPSKRQKNSYTLEFKLKLVEEAKKLSIAAISKIGKSFHKRHLAIFSAQRQKIVR